MAEILTFAGFLFLVSTLPIVIGLMYFVEKLDDPKYMEKVFKKTIWNKS